MSNKLLLIPLSGIQSHVTTRKIVDPGPESWILDSKLSGGHRNGSWSSIRWIRIPRSGASHLLDSFATWRISVYPRGDVTLRSRVTYPWETRPVARVCHARDMSNKNSDSTREISEFRSFLTVGHGYTGCSGKISWDTIVFMVLWQASAACCLQLTADQKFDLSWQGLGTSPQIILL